VLAQAALRVFLLHACVPTVGPRALIAAAHAEEDPTIGPDLRALREAVAALSGGPIAGLIDLLRELAGPPQREAIHVVIPTG